jgi:hypothetical protein
MNIGAWSLRRQPSPFVARAARMAVQSGEHMMAKGQAKSNKEAKKPKKEVKKTIAANPSTKGKVITE